MLLEPQARRTWLTRGPYLTAGLYLLLLAPHLQWALHQGFPTAEHFYKASQSTRGIGNWLIALLGFAGGQAAVMAPAALLVIVLARAGNHERQLSLGSVATTFDRRFVAALAIGPFLVAVLVSAMTGREFLVHWGYPMWCFIGLFVVVFLTPTVSEVGLRQFGRAWASVFLIMALLYATAITIVPYLRQAGISGVTKGFMTKHFLDRQQQPHFPGPELAQAITRQWHATFGSRLAYVVGNKWVAGNVAFFSPDRPSVFLGGHPEESPWIDVASLHELGAAVVWDPDQIELEGRMKQRLPEMEIQPPLMLPWATSAALPPLSIGWAIIRPRPPGSGNSASGKANGMP
jgi:hypothetical protein